MLLAGIEAGAYHLPSPDLGQNLLVSGMTSLRCGAWAGWWRRCGTSCTLQRCRRPSSALGRNLHWGPPLHRSPRMQHRRTATPSPPSLSALSSPKRFWLPLQVLLGPILPLATSVFTWLGDRAARKHNQQHGMPPRA